jgi:hypothetical protein
MARRSESQHDWDPADLCDHTSVLKDCERRRLEANLSLLSCPPTRLNGFRDLVPGRLPLAKDTAACFDKERPLNQGSVGPATRSKCLVEPPMTVKAIRVIQTLHLTPESSGGGQLGTYVMAHMAAGG